MTAAADGEQFLRCNRPKLHPHDEYTLAQHKVSSQLEIPSEFTTNEALEAFERSSFYFETRSNT